MTKAANLGFPRIGVRRELKKALEHYWKGDIDVSELETKARMLKARHWQLQRDEGIDVIPSNDFSFYDQVLDTTALFGAVPRRFGSVADTVPLELYFSMARGTAAAPAMEMTKWFDTNYHYIVPEFHRDQTFHLASTKPIDDYLEAKALGIETRPVVLGPVSWLGLGKSRTEGFHQLDHLQAILPLYAELLERLAKAGAEWVQIDEPLLVTDLSEEQRSAFAKAYGALSNTGPKIMLASYFGALGDNLDLACSLPVAGIHTDLVRAPEQLEQVLAAAPDKHLSLGLVDGRNVWKSDLKTSLVTIRQAFEGRSVERVQIAPSCSLLHVPVDLEQETELDAELKDWLAFAKQKLAEVKTLALALKDGGKAVASTLIANERASNARKTSLLIHNAAVKARTAAIREEDRRRTSSFVERMTLQKSQLRLPKFPTTTIGSFPQTQAVRRARADHRKGQLSNADYEAFLKNEIKTCIRKQEALGLDVPVHGEFERNDMVEYFGEQLSGFAFTRFGWVQSYGSRCVKPPLIFGDVSRPAPMTVRWSSYAQSLTDRPMKGMLTGPVTILQWSFVRDDQPRAATCEQIALAIRDEVADLEGAGIRLIQIDEPALREGLPLRRSEWDAYLKWAVESFRLAASSVGDATQIHTHMCYSEFNDIMPAIARLDADVISIETSRSDMELLTVFGDFAYPNDIGPGIWDIHSPRVPPLSEMTKLLRKAAEVISSERLWVNPDCGLKTRGWAEAEASLKNLVGAAKTLRQEHTVAAAE